MSQVVLDARATASHHDRKILRGAAMLAVPARQEVEAWKPGVSSLLRGTCLHQLCSEELAFKAMPLHVC